MSFTKAAGKAPAAVAAAVKPGKQALTREHARQINCTRVAALTASVDLDDALHADPKYAQASRWDYGLGYKIQGGEEVAIWAEVHSATTGEVRAMLKKLEWLKQYLREECEDLWKLTLAAEAPYHWVASKRVAILRNSPQARLLSRSALPFPRSVLTLP